MPMPYLKGHCVKSKQWQLDSEFVKCKFCECREYLQTRFWRVSCWCCDSPDSPTFAQPCYADSPDSTTFAEPCFADSPDSTTFAKPCCTDSPDSWKTFYAYKICYLFLKQPILARLRRAVSRGLARLANIRRDVSHGLADIRRAVLRGLANTRRTVLRGLARLANTRFGANLARVAIA